MADHSRVSCLHLILLLVRMVGGAVKDMVLYFSGEFDGGSVGMLSCCDIFFLQGAIRVCGLVQRVGMYSSQARSTRKQGGQFCLSAQIIAGGLSYKYKNLIPVSGYFLPGTSSLITVIGQMQGYLGISVSTAETICGELS